MKARGRQVISASGRLTVKIECQPNRPVSRPPRTGPKAVVAMLARDSTPMAYVRVAAACRGRSD